MPKSYSGDKISVTGKEVGSLYPTNRQEVSQSIFLDGSGEIFDIRGGVFSSNITIVGGGIVKGPVLSKNDIQIKDTSKPVVFQSGITAKNSLVVAESGKSAPENRLSHSVKNVKVIIRGDVISPKSVVLNDTVVIGSILAPNITLRNCIVYGAIKNSKQVSVHNSSIGIYITERISFSGANGFFITGGKSQDIPDFIPDTKEENAPHIRYIPLCRLSGYGCQMGKDIEQEVAQSCVGLSCSLWVKKQCPFAENISVEKVDFVQLTFEQEKSWYLGLQGRSLSLAKINEINNSFNRTLHGLFAYDHLSNQNKELEASYWKDLSDSEKEIFMMATK